MARPKEPKIDREFREFLPDCGPAEHAELRQSIIDDGVRDPLVVWEETGLLVDGHRRFAICKSIKSLKYRYVVKSFGEHTQANRAKVKAWMAQNQLGRRNLTPEMVSYFRGKQYLAERAADRSGNLPTAQNEPLGESTELQGENDDSNYEKGAHRTAERLAAEHGVGQATIRRDAAFAEAVDSHPEKAAILAGTSGLKKKDVVRPTMCNRCTRVGISTKGCKDCAALNPGKPTPKPRKPASGSAFPWPTYDFHFGKLARLVDEVIVFYGDEKNRHEYKEAVRTLEEFADVMATWRKRLTASGGR